MDKMKELISGFADQLRQAIAIGEAAQLPAPKGPVRTVNVFGLGGSAFGGEVVRNYAFTTAKAPILIPRGYTPPAYLGPDDLLILSSYSGNTEETLIAAKEALAAGATTVCISSGGELKQLAAANGFPFIEVPGGYPPRTACGFSIVQQLYVLRHYGVIPDFKAHLDEAVALIDRFATGFTGLASTKTLADNLNGKVPVIYSSDAADSAAIRLRQQINENAKQLCWHHVIPEMNHNELVGWELPESLLANAVVVLLRTDYDHERVQLRYNINREIIEPKAAQFVEVQAQGESKLAQLLWLLHFSDWVSYFLAENNGVDPMPVKVIDHLKGSLAKSVYVPRQKSYYLGHIEGFEQN